jgi:hypothetical protein
MKQRPPNPRLIAHRREDNAFVRVTVPMEKRSAEEAYAVGLSFIKAFYPQFLAHVQESTS